MYSNTVQMSLQQTLQGSSFPVTITAADYNSTTGRFTKTFGRNVDLSGFQVAVAQLSMYNSTQNIRASFNNNRITIRFPAAFTANPLTGAPISQNYFDLDVVFPDGWYTLENILAYIVSQMYNAKLYAVSTSGLNNTYFLNLEMSPTSYGSRLTLNAVQADASYTIPSGASWTFLTAGNIRNVTLTIPSGSNFGALLGFTTGARGGNNTSEAFASTLCPVINVISAFQFCTNIVHNPLCSPTNVLYTQSIIAANGDIMVPQITPLYMPCTSGSFWTLELWFMDQSGNPYAMFDTEFTCTLNFLKTR